MRTRRKIIEIDEALCNGCGECVPSCAEGAIRVVEGKARLVSERYCDGLGACIGACPTGALRVVAREAEGFSEEAVAERVQAAANKASVACPSARVQGFSGGGRGGERVEGEAVSVSPSALSHWPVQIRLTPPTAPFLEGADLLIAADCVPVAYGGFQALLDGKVVMIGCPKFDDGNAYVEQFAAIFRTAEVKRVTVVVMEVPCCQGLPIMVAKGMARACKQIPIEKVVVSLRGEVLERAAFEGVVQSAVTAPAPG